MGGVSADGEVFWLSGPERRSRLCDLHARREPAREDPGRAGAAQALRLAAARPALR